MTSAPRRFPWLVVVGVLAVALSLRAPILALAPVLRDIERDLGVGSATAGFLTTAPVLMFAVLTPLAAYVIRRAGAERAVLIALVGVLIGTMIRTLPGFAALLIGMVVIGAAIALGNVVVPVVIRRDVPDERVASVMAAYTAVLNVGSLLTSLLTAPLASATGWAAALALWGLITVGGLTVWCVYLDRRRRWSTPDTPEPAVTVAGELSAAEALTGPVRVALPAATPILRNPIVWLLTISFGLQAAMYYGISAWLPTMTSDLLGYSASTSAALASIYQGVGIIGAFVVPALARVPSRFAGPSVICVSWLVLGAGLLWAPEHIWLWLSIGSVGHAGGFVVVFSTLVAVSRSDADAASGSALIQGVGYGVAATAAPLIGGLHELTGAWTVPLIVILVSSVAYCATLTMAVAAASRR